MTDHALHRAGRRTPDLVRGFTLIELVLVVLLVGTLAAYLYKQVSYYQERAELVAMEQTAGAFRSGLQYRVAAYLVSRHPDELVQLSRENPVNWLADKPSNYAGAFFGEPPTEVKAGDWYYDLQNNTMVYLVRQKQYFVPGVEGFRIRFRARVDYGPLRGADGRPLGDSKGVRAVEFQPVEPYRWFE